MGVCEYGHDVMFVHQGNLSLVRANVLLVSAWRTLRRILALVFMLPVCVLNDMSLSYVSPSVVGVLV